MSRMVGTVSRGVRAPIIREGDDLAQIVTQSVLEAGKEEGFTSWYMAPGGGGPDRKYYRLTRLGRERLDSLRGDWRHMRDAIASFGVE